MRKRKHNVQKSSFDKMLEHGFHQILHTFEDIIAIITIVALILVMCREIMHLPNILHSFEELSTFLHHVLTIVVGVEFVHMIIDPSPSSILEVLSVAITRYVVLNHEDPWSNLACIVCIAILFATRRFLIAPANPAAAPEKDGEKD